MIEVGNGGSSSSSLSTATADTLSVIMYPGAYANYTSGNWSHDSEGRMIAFYNQTMQLCLTAGSTIELKECSGRTGTTTTPHTHRHPLSLAPIALQPRTGYLAPRTPQPSFARLHLHAVVRAYAITLTHPHAPCAGAASHDRRSD